MQEKKHYLHKDVVAIVTAMTNEERPFLSETLQAVLSDEGISEVILCVDEHNGWLDATLGTKLKDTRVFVLRMPLMNIGAVRNRALTYVNKSWVAFCDGDDVWCSNKTLKQRQYAAETMADFVGSGHYLTDEQGNIRAVGTARFIPMPSSWLVRTAVLRSFLFDENRAQSSDGDWWIKTENKIKKVKFPALLLRYRVRTRSLSSITYSKSKKLKIVTFARIPLLGQAILGLSYLIWICTRKQQYKWLPRWSKKYSILKSHIYVIPAKLLLAEFLSLITLFNIYLSLSG